MSPWAAAGEHAAAPLGDIKTITKNTKWNSSQLATDARNISKALLGSQAVQRIEPTTWHPKMWNTITCCSKGAEDNKHQKLPVDVWIPSFGNTIICCFSQVAYAQSTAPCSASNQTEVRIETIQLDPQSWKMKTQLYAVSWKLFLLNA